MDEMQVSGTTPRGTHLCQAGKGDFLAMANPTQVGRGMPGPPFSLQVRVPEIVDAWRKPLLFDQEGGSLNANLVATCFKPPEVGEIEREAVTPDEFYTLAVNLSRGRTIAFSNHRQLFNGITQPGMIHIAQPGDHLKAVFLKPAHSYHVFIPVQKICMLLEESASRHSRAELGLSRPGFVVDRGLYHLVRSLAHLSTDIKPIDQLYADGLSMAVVASVLARYSNHSESSRQYGRQGLRSWELQKIDDYVDGNMEETISLLNLASVVGLSRMHFASQFRHSTGIRPHEYVLRRRIFRAQQLLRRPTSNVLDTALTVGFETQSHFSTVFKRIIGETPARWRLSHGC